MRKVIYTSLVGNYDTLREHTYVMQGWDYICFSDDLDQNNYSTWKIKPIPFKNSDKGRLSRYAKLNPHLLLNEYDFSIWIDANINVLDNTLEMSADEKIKKNILFSVAKHPYRNCIYEEANECIRLGRDKKRKIKKQVNFLRKEKYPEGNGLFENNIIFRRHNNREVIKVDELWWSIFQRYTKRDQLSLAYALWKLNIECEHLFEEGFDVRANTGFDHVIHDKNDSIILRRRIRFALEKLKIIWEKKFQ